MNAVIYYSNTGESKRIADYVAEQTGFCLVDLTTTSKYVYDTAVVVFPVYCQNVPEAVDEFLKKLQAEHAALIATYGKMSYGNVLNEIQRKYRFDIIAAAYVPTKHAYLNEPIFNGFDRLAPLVNKLSDGEKRPTTVEIPKSNKNPFANLAPLWRSRQGVKITRNDRCNGCGQCAKICPEHAIENGETNRNCIRCARCVTNCPQGALSLKLTYPMRRYLKKHKKDELIIYV